MRFRIAGILLIVSIAACGPSGDSPPVSVTTDERNEAEPIPRGTPCPECGGSGFSLRSGYQDLCLLCDREGACAVCRGDGAMQGTDCIACDRTGRCTACADPAGAAGDCPGCAGQAGAVTRLPSTCA